MESPSTLLPSEPGDVDVVYLEAAVHLGNALIDVGNASRLYLLGKYRGDQGTGVLEPALIDPCLDARIPAYTAQQQRVEVVPRKFL